MEYLFNPIYAQRLHSMIFNLIYPKRIIERVKSEVKNFFSFVINMIFGSFIFRKISQFFSHLYNILEESVRATFSLHNFLKGYFILTASISSIMIFIFLILRKLYQPTKKEVVDQLKIFLKWLAVFTVGKIIFFAWFVKFLDINYSIQILKMRFFCVSYFWTFIMIFELIIYSSFQFTIHLARLTRKEKRLVRIKQCYPAIPCIGFLITFCTFSILQTYGDIQLAFFCRQIPISIFFTIYATSISDAFIRLFDDIFSALVESQNLHLKYQEMDHYIE